MLKLILISKIMMACLVSAQTNRPGMAIEFSREGFEKYIKLNIIPEIFEDALNFNNSGLCYNKICMGTAVYAINPPDYRDATVSYVDGGGENAF